MTVSIKSANPILKKVSQFRYEVNLWLVKGMAYADPEECQCKTKAFETWIELNALDIEEDKLIELVIEKLKK